jgi:hypothetical protein
MKPDDQAPKTPRLGADAVEADWPRGAEEARDATVRRLRSLTPEPYPEEADSLERTQYQLRSVDDEPARLVYDSNIDAELLVGVRTGGQTLRQLTFEAGEIVLEIELSTSGHLVGQIVPPQVGVVELRHRTGTTPVQTDELGYFRVPAMPEGPVSFRCRPGRSAGHSIATSWITL